MTLNKDKLAVKYILGTFLDSKDYPTLEDAMFQIINFGYLNNSSSLTEIDLVNIFKGIAPDKLSTLVDNLINTNFLTMPRVIKGKSTHDVLYNPFE